MSFTFSIGYRSPISSKSLNDKLHEVWGRNGVLDGFIMSKHSNSEVKVSSGVSMIQGVKVLYKEDNASNPLKVSIPLNRDGNIYVYGLYNHKLSSFVIRTTDSKYDAQGEYKVFLGHAEIVGGALLNIQPIVEPSHVDIESIYRRMPNMNELINFFYESTGQMGDQIDVVLNGVIGNMKTLKTEHKATVVGSINELFDTKEPTLNRDRILELLGNGSDGGNIDIDFINGIPVKNFVLKDRAIRTGASSGLKGGGDLSVDRELSINWGNEEHQVPKGNHNHDGYHLSTRFLSKFGTNGSAAVYSHLGYYTNTSSISKAVKVTLPKGFTDTSIAIEINGHDVSLNTSSFTLKIGGYLDKTTSSWKLCKADILGSAPFSTARFGKDSEGKACIILGNSSTNWNKSALFIKEALVSGSDSVNWNAGWSISTIDSESGIIIDESPKIVTGGPQGGEYVPPNRGIIAEEGLIGGGTLQNDVKLKVKFGTDSSSAARGNHTHSNYLGKTMSAKNGILVTDGSGNIKVDPIVWDYELQRLKGVKSNIQDQINSKAASSHKHNDYFLKTGGAINGSITLGDNQNHKLSAYFLYLRGYRLTIAGSEPGVKNKGTVWIDLPF